MMKYTVVVRASWWGTSGAQLLTVVPVERGEAERLVRSLTESWRSTGLKPTVTVERTGVTTARLVVTHEPAMI